MTYRLAVWHSDEAPSTALAADLFRRLNEQELVPVEQYPTVYGFYNELTGRYPEVEMLPEEELENCPWASGHERSGRHVIMGLMSEELTHVTALILELARKYSLVCFDPQNGEVHLPLHMQARPPVEGAGHGMAAIVHA